jgi:hypothetical protein
MPDYNNRDSVTFRRSPSHTMIAPKKRRKLNDGSERARKFFDFTDRSLLTLTALSAIAARRARNEAKSQIASAQENEDSLQITTNLTSAPTTAGHSPISKSSPKTNPTHRITSAQKNSLGDATREGDLPTGSS